MIRSAAPAQFPAAHERAMTARRIDSSLGAAASVTAPAAARAAIPRAARALEVHTGRERNPGTPMDLDIVRAIRVNRSAVERRAMTLPARRTVKKEWQAGWLLRAVTLIDLTTLSSDDTPSNVLRLCAKARSPVRADLLRDAI